MSVSLTAADIASLVNGTVDGNPERAIGNVAKLEEAGPGDLAFFANPKYIHQFNETRASVVIVPNDLKTEGEMPFTMVRAQIPYLAFCMVLDRHFNPNVHKTGVEEGSFVAKGVQVPEGAYIGHSAYVDEAAVLGKNVKIYPQVFVGRNVEIGEGTVLYPGVKVYANCKIGKNSIIHSGTIIGADGFGHAPMPDGRYAKIPQIGNVVIGDDVEIGSNCTIDRATMGSTVIRNGVKLDNLIQVAHNAEIGENTVVASQAGISGSTKLGKNCMIGGQVGMVGHITIADGTQIAAQSGVMNAITEKGQAWMGSPVQPLKEHMKSLAVFRNLPEMKRNLHDLQKQVNALKENDEND